MGKTEAVAQSRKFINDLVAPEKMSQQEALDVLEEIASDIDGMIDALKVNLGQD